MSRLCGILAVALITAQTAFAAEQAYVVIRSTAGAASSLKVGHQVGAGSLLSLQANESVTLLSANGQSITLKGPHTGPVPSSLQSGKEGDSGIVARLSKFLGEREISTSSLGAIRSGPPRTREPTDVWMVVVGDRAPQCIRSNILTLWRRSADRDATLHIRSTVGQKIETTWARGVNAFEMPASVQSDRADFEAILDGASSPIAVHVAPSGLDNPALLLDWMIVRKCDRQAALYLATLK